jgi:predicted flavoprotein YhiN
MGRKKIYSEFKKKSTDPVYGKYFGARLNTEQQKNLNLLITHFGLSGEKFTPSKVIRELIEKESNIIRGKQ